MSLQVTPTPLLEHIHEIFSTGQYPPCPPNVEKGTRIALHTAERTPVASATAKGGGSRRFRRDIIKLFMRQNAGSAPPMHVFNDSRNCTFNEASGDGRFWPLATEDHALAQEYSTQRAPKKSDAPPQPVLYIPIPVLERISQNPLGSGQLTVPVTQNLDPRGSIEEVHVFVQCPDEESMAEYKGAYRLIVDRKSQFTREHWRAAREYPTYWTRLQLGPLPAGPGERGTTPLLNFVKHMHDEVKVRDMGGFVYFPSLRPITMKRVGFDEDLLTRMEELTIEVELIGS